MPDEVELLLGRAEVGGELSLGGEDLVEKGVFVFVFVGVGGGGLGGCGCAFRATTPAWS